MRGRNLTKATKLLMYKTLIHPVHGNINRTIMKNMERQLLVFERKILRNLSGPMTEGDSRRIHHYKLDALYGEPNVVKFIKLIPDHIRQVMS